MRRIAHPLLPALVAALLLASCARPGGSDGPIDHPSGNDLILRIEWSGGMLPLALQLTSLPTFTLSGDGRVIVPGAQIDIFPGPALPSVNVRRLTEEGIQAVLAEVASTGLFGANAEYLGARNCVADATDTVFTLHADGRDRVVKIHGLGMLAPGASCPGVTVTELAAHRTLQALSERLGNLDAQLPSAMWANPTWRPYEPDALRLMVRNADADAPDDSGIQGKLLDWPDSSDPATFGAPMPPGGERCGVVSGQPARDWYAALSGANQLTRFVNGDHRYAVTVRQQLPDEPPECPTLAS